MAQFGHVFTGQSAQGKVLLLRRMRFDKGLL